MRRDTYRLPSITLLAVLVEFALIIIVSVNATSQFLNPDPSLKVPGHEGEWLASSAQFASFSWKEFHYLPLWQPYLRIGEPLIDNPFSMVLNPISTLPALIWGGNVGTRYAVVLSTVLAALGGWALARVLGLGSLGRILLAILMAGKGNMMGMIGQGYFQLGVSQAYIPWVIAGTIGILRMKHRRYPVILTAVMLTLMFWAGNIYFLLPTLMSVAGLALTHLFQTVYHNGKKQLQVDRPALRRLVLAALLTIGLSAITFLPIFIQQNRVGGHPNETGMGTYADLISVARMLVSPSLDNYTIGNLPGGTEFYQSYVLPLWFALLIFILLPPVTKALQRASTPQSWKVWSVGVFMIIFCGLWAAGQNPLIGWLYANVPLLAQWRFVGRMLGIVSFWIAVLATMRLDGLWRAVVLEGSWRRIPVVKSFVGSGAILAVAIIGVTLYAASDVIAQWKIYALPDRTETDECVDWLRLQNPNTFLSVWTLDYNIMTSYMQNNVRHANITADFFVIPNAPTLYMGDLTRLQPEYGIAWSDGDRAYLEGTGYVVMDNSPIRYGSSCMWRKADAVAYAFTASVDDLNQTPNPLPVSLTTPITQYREYPDRIFLSVPSSPDKAVAAVVQETAYPGWTAEVDGQPAPIESVGGLIGTVLPPGAGEHSVVFSYRPPLLLIGGALTLLTVVIGILYLLNLDRYIPKRYLSNGQTIAQRSARSILKTLTSTQLFDPKAEPQEDPPRRLPSPDDEDVVTVEPDDPAPAARKSVDGGAVTVEPDDAPESTP